MNDKIGSEIEVVEKKILTTEIKMQLKPKNVQKKNTTDQEGTTSTNEQSKVRERNQKI